MREYELIHFPDFISGMPTTTGYAYLTTKQTQQYFKWFQEIMPERIAYMLECCSTEIGVPIEELKAFPDGFVPIWKWFLTRQTMRNSTPEELAEFERKFGFLGGDMWIPKKILDETTECLHIDIGMFLGDQFIRHYPNDLKWGYFLRPKRSVLVKSPIIWGFEKGYTKRGKPTSLAVNPIHSVGGISRKIFVSPDSLKEDDLLMVAHYLMNRVYDIDSKRIISPLQL